MRLAWRGGPVDLYEDIAGAQSYCRGYIYIYIYLDAKSPFVTARTHSASRASAESNIVGSSIAPVLGSSEETSLRVAIYVAIGAQSSCYTDLLANARAGKTPQESLPCYRPTLLDRKRPPFLVAMANSTARFSSNRAVSGLQSAYPTIGVVAETIRTLPSWGPGQ